MLLVNMHGFFLSKKRHIKNDFQKNLDKSNPKPKKIWLYKGSEFDNRNE